MLLAACGAGIRLQEPTLVTQQAARLVEIRIGETTRTDARLALGEPWLQSEFWRVDVFRAEDEERELTFIIPPVPMGVFHWTVGGYGLITYDGAGRITAVASGQAFKGFNKQGAMMLRADELNLSVEPIDNRGPQLTADASRLPEYLERSRESPMCTVILACERPAAREKFPDEGCPDRVVIDEGEALDPRPLLATCEAGSRCPPNAVRWVEGVHVRVPLLVPVRLAPGGHRLVMASSVFKGRSEATFECSAGEVQYGFVRGQVSWHWWGARTSTLVADVIMAATPPANWETYSVLLFRGDRWVVEPDPSSSPRTPPDRD